QDPQKDAEDEDDRHDHLGRFGPTGMAPHEIEPDGPKNEEKQDDCPCFLIPLFIVVHSRISPFPRWQNKEGFRHRPPFPGKLKIISAHWMAVSPTGAMPLGLKITKSGTPLHL